jgi:hypothetical protein
VRGGELVDPHGFEPDQALARVGSLRLVAHTAQRQRRGDGVERGLGAMRTVRSGSLERHDLVVCVLRVQEIRPLL